MQDYLAGWPMTLGRAPGQADLFRTTAAYCEGRVAPDSIYGILHRERFSCSGRDVSDLLEHLGCRSIAMQALAEPLTSHDLARTRRNCADSGLPDRSRTRRKLRRTISTDEDLRLYPGAFDRDI